MGWISDTIKKGTGELITTSDREQSIKDAAAEKERRIRAGLVPEEAQKEAARLAMVSEAGRAPGELRARIVRWKARWGKRGLTPVRSQPPTSDERCHSEAAAVAPCVQDLALRCRLRHKSDSVSRQESEDSQRWRLKRPNLA